jgi:hypothetical protein
MTFDPACCLVRVRGEASYLFSGEVFVSPAQQRLDLVVQKETELRLEEGAEFVCLLSMGVCILSVFG